jgi:hypothetical protein
MGSMLEINDTLQITTEQGFPADILDLNKHRANPITAQSLAGKVFEFYDKPGARFYQHAPVRVYLVHNIGGKWLFWGRIFVQSQTITGDSEKTTTTKGTYVVTDVYDPAYQEMFTRRESPPGKSFL